MYKYIISRPGLSLLKVLTHVYQTRLIDLQIRSHLAAISTMWHDVMLEKQQKKGLFSDKWWSDSPRRDCQRLIDSSLKVGTGHFTRE